LRLVKLLRALAASNHIRLYYELSLLRCKAVFFRLTDILNWIDPWIKHIRERFH
jgi:hypothetical protein